MHMPRSMVSQDNVQELVLFLPVVGDTRKYENTVLRLMTTLAVEEAVDVVLRPMIVLTPEEVGR